MMQNSLERLFEGLVTMLRDTVAPALDDRYARAQVMAAVELLANLATRVEWSCGVQLGAIERVRAVLEDAPPEAPSAVSAVVRDPIPGPTDAAGLEEARRAHYEALAALQGWLNGVEGHDALRDAVADFVRWDLESELARLRSGKYPHDRGAKPA